MTQSNIQSLSYFAPQNPSIFPANFAFTQSNSPPLHSIPFHEFTNSCIISNNSTSDDTDDNHLTIIDDRKQRRMISNRESARRSRMRKQRQLNELWAQILRLRMENDCLIEKMNLVYESHGRVLQENVRLKEEASDLRQKLTDLQDNSIFRHVEELPCNTDHLTSEFSVSDSKLNLLH